MLSPSVIARIEQIAQDRASGATELGIKAADVLNSIPPAQLPAAVAALLRAQPAMASVYNAAKSALEGKLQEFRDRLRRSSEVIARKAAPMVRGRVVFTHSSSSNVLRALQEGDPARVICTESLPGGEGRSLATLLSADVVPDAGTYCALAKIDLVLLGADAVTPETVVNKIGTSMIALGARERGKPVWVLCGADKFVPPDWVPQLGELFEATPRGWFTGIVDDC